jgi:hypothetical protein
VPVACVARLRPFDGLVGGQVVACGGPGPAGSISRSSSQRGPPGGRPGFGALDVSGNAGAVDYRDGGV